MKRILITILLVHGMVGCTIEVPFEPSTINDTDWIPTISLAENNYNRFALMVSQPPRKELMRSIAFGSVELRAIPGTFARSDSVPFFFFRPPTNPYWSPELYFESSTLVGANTDFEARFSIYYLDGTVHTSESIFFTAAAIPGSAVHALGWQSVDPTFGYVGYDTRMAFSDGTLYILNNAALYRADTVGSQLELVSDSFAPPADDQYSTFDNLAIQGDTLFSFHPPYTSQDQYKLVRYFLQTNSVDSTLVVENPDVTKNFFLQGLFGEQSQLFSLWGNFEGEAMLAELNPVTGEIIQTLPMTSSRANHPYGFCMVNGIPWVSNNSRFDNRIIAYDPSSSALIEEHRNPIFRPIGLAWDGEHFWVVDLDRGAIVKLQLEGI